VVSAVKAGHCNRPTGTRLAPVVKGEDAGKRGRDHPLRRDALANQERVLAAAVTMMLREGRQVPMATIAAEAGVGVGTLYRRYPNREALLAELTLRAFELLTDLVQRAAAREGSALDRIGWYWDRVIEQREQLVLPLHGGPRVSAPAALAARTRLHQSLRRILQAGQREGSIRLDVDVADLIIFGAMLVAPLPGASDWDAVAARQKNIHLDGLAARPRPAPPPT